MWKRFSIISLIWAGICYLVLLSSIDSSKMDFDYVKGISMMFPQGWGFFTKNPHDYMIDCYELNGDELKLLTQKNFSTSNFFGLSRKSRYLGYEISLILSNLPFDQKWGKFTGTIDYSSINSIKTDTVQFPSDLLVFEKDKIYVAHKYKQIPFEWLDQGQELYRPYELLKFVIK